ncbi:MAG: hypothetical protein JSV62_15675 [Promethearchaeota archaeon]|nr:MAG: hypothetical protein JSV62_15675 [Candidatus Lokiarchaeota archaeon]
MVKYTINKYLDLRFEKGKTNIYIDNKLFMHCKYILLNIPKDLDENLIDIKSIDEAVEKLDRSFEIPGIRTININPKVQFWAHCSNLQAWHENNYNTCLIHSNLAFPLLRELTKAGDLIAKLVFKEEMAKRFECKNLNVIQFLLYNDYLDDLNKEELDIVLKHLKANLFEIIKKQLGELMKSIVTNYRKIKEIIDLLLFIDLKYNKNLIFSIFNNFNKNLNIHFARFLILYLNYKEFVEYRIPYGRFFVYFEKFLDFIYDKYPEIKEFLKIVDSGFLSGAISLDEKYSYGAVSYYSSM